MNVALEVKAIETLPQGWRVLRVHGAEFTQHYRPGFTAQIDDALYPVMSCEPASGTLSIALAPEQTLKDTPHFQRWQGQALHLTDAPCLLLGQDGGIFALVPLLAQARQRKLNNVLTLLGATHGFPFQPAPSRIYLPDMPGHVIATMPLLDDWSLPGRLASTADLPGCFDGELSDFAEHWLTTLDSTDTGKLNLIVAGSSGWCEAVQVRLAARVDTLQSLRIDAKRRT